MRTLVYKAVGVASSPVFEPHPTTVFAWNSHLLDDVPSFDYPFDIMETLIKEHNHNIINIMSGPDLVGVSIWRGTVSVEYCQEVRCTQTFQGEWSDLNMQDWGYLMDRDLEGLVRLDRFTVHC